LPRTTRPFRYQKVKREKLEKEDVSSAGGVEDLEGRMGPMWLLSTPKRTRRKLTATRPKCTQNETLDLKSSSRSRLATTLEYKTTLEGRSSAVQNTSRKPLVVWPLWRS